jgi:pimeloyl-ACP methyl ester carboxylesterase
MSRTDRLIHALAIGASTVLLVGCGSGSSVTAHSTSRKPRIGRADIGGYSLAYQCAGHGTPTVILEAGYTASGLDTYGQTILPAIARTTRVCTYDRAGDGISDPRPTWVNPLTAATQARELHRLLVSIHVKGPYVVVGHSYGGMISREFAALYPDAVVGMVLIDASSEPEIPVYDRLHAGPWIDGTVSPAPNQRIDIHATVRQLEHAPPLGPLPLVVITAGILEDKWLRTVPMLEARAQTRLAGLSTNSIHVVDRGVGHFIPEHDPTIVLTAVLAIVRAAQSHSKLPACPKVFAAVRSAHCLTRNETYRQRT